VVLDNLWRGTLENLKDDSGTPVIDLNRDFINVDLTDRKATLETVRCARVVYHLADIVAGVDFVFGNQGFVFEQNLLINTNVLAACRNNRFAHYIYVGTACSFPKHLQMSYSITALHENQTYPASPESSYGWSKLMGEYQAQLMLKEPKGVGFRPNITILRLHNDYGPGMQFGETSQALPALIRKAINYPDYEKFKVWGSGQQYRDFTYVDDVVNALLLAQTRAVDSGTVQIGTGVGVTLRESAAVIAALAKEAFGKDVHPQFTSEKPEGDRGRVAVLERAENVLHWKPKVYIAEGLARTFAWIAWRMLHSETTQPDVRKKLRKFFQRENKKDGASSNVVLPPSKALKDRLRKVAKKAYAKEKPTEKVENATSSTPTEDKSKDKKRAKLNEEIPPTEQE
jgi:nucleoside-diphosphate-sugar epimerase